MTESGDASPLSFPEQSPVFRAQHASRYERQDLIRMYEEAFGCRLVVVIDVIFDHGITFLVDLLYDARPDTDLHMLLHSRGGDGETAIRMAREAQARCKELTVIVPDRAKSAATLLTLGANHILMSPSSDLGPIDPQLLVDRDLIAAKDIIAAVEDAEKKVQQAPETFPFYASLLRDVDSLMVQRARSALARTGDQLQEALRSNPFRSPAEVKKLSQRLQRPLISGSPTHAALFGAQDASRVGLPVFEADLQGDQWQLLWRLWAKYFQQGAVTQMVSFYEGARASWVFEEGPPF